MDRKYKVTPTNLLYLFLLLAIPMICVSGVSVYPVNLRPYLVVCVGAACVFLTLFVRKKLELNLITVSALFLCGMIIFSLSYSADATETAEFCVTYLACIFLLFADLPENLFERIIFVFKIFCLIIAVSIILSVFIDDFILTYFSFIINPKNDPSISHSIFKEIKYCHAYSGLAKERSDAAYIMNVGIAIVLAKFFSGRKAKASDIITLIIFVLGLVFTNKRMLFVIPVIAFAVMMLLGNLKSKLIKFVSVAAIAVVGFLVLAAFIPQFSNIYDRFMLTDSTDVLNGREELWEYSLYMFRTSPIIGHGFGSFNKYSYENGLLVDGERWYFFGHNCYYEVLGELGIIGAIIFAFAFIIPLIYTAALIYKRIGTKSQQQLLMFSLYIQIMFFVYSFSGNPLFVTDQTVMWFFAIAVTLCVKKSNDFRLTDKKRLERLSSRRSRKAARQTRRSL